MKGVQEWLEASPWKSWRKKVRSDVLLDLSSIPECALGFVLAALRQGRHGVEVVQVSSVKLQEELSHDLEVWGVPSLFFPEREPEIEGALADPSLASERLSVLNRLQKGFDGLLLVTEAGWTQSVPPPDALSECRWTFEVGKSLDEEALADALREGGFQKELQVQGRGQFSRRGNILDLFPWDAAYPLRVEVEDDTVGSLRWFDLATQRSVEKVERAEGALSATPMANSSLTRYLPEKVIRFHHGATPMEEFEALEPELYPLDFLQGQTQDWVLAEQRRELFFKNLRGWLSEKWTVLLCCNNEGEQRRMQEVLRENGFEPDLIQMVILPLLRGFVWKEAKRVLLADAEIFGRYQTFRAGRRQEHLTQLRVFQPALDFADLPEGTPVVHRNHGICLFRGIQPIPGGTDEALVLEFDEQAKLFVPLDQAHLVNRYIGAGKSQPPLDVLGGARWEKARHAAKRAVWQYAEALLRVHAERETLAGHAFSADTPWQDEFESAFLYDETPDQLRAILATKQDMENLKPMDRLICGDVGFGKTEIAIRAVFKAVMGGRQAAFLVPTTVLAQQHYQNLRERFADYPIRVELLSRFRTQGEQTKTVQELKAGSVDVIVGTHRLISKDVEFKNLGLVVVDEEQRFGVKQKEKFKERFRLIDILTLSATPIPRTLYLALTGMKDMSTIETPPKARHSVETIVCPYDEKVIREAIRREMARNGQIYFLHNRVKTIEKVAERLRFLVPEARIAVGHGQMNKDELEEVMADFVGGKSDLLLSTTIIESGLDIPNANTIFIDRADRFGLADLYQLRGRVGRAQHKAYAYLMLPREWMGIGEAKRRVSAIKQYSELGAGFKIAMRDLEIRGAGNILGTAQSGHITAVGFELYCQLLKTAVSQMKGETRRELSECKLDLDFLTWKEGEESQYKRLAALPKRYLQESRWRIEGYRRLSELTTVEEWKSLKEEWRDRYGDWPDAVELLLETYALRILASERNISMIQVEGGKLVIKRNDDFVMIGGKFPRLTATAALSKLLEIKQWIESLERRSS